MDGRDDDISNFKKNHPTNADEKISKLFERSPLGSALLESASLLDPDVLRGNT